MRRLLALVVTVLVGGLAAETAVAQSGCGAQREQGNFEVVLGPAAVSFPQPQTSHFMAGQITLSSPLQITVTPQSAVGNNTWYVCVRTLDPNLGGYGKPLSDLQFYNSQTGHWISLSNQFIQLGAYQGLASRTISVPVRLLLRIEDDTPGTYGPTPLAFEFSR